MILLYVHWSVPRGRLVFSTAHSITLLFVSGLCEGPQHSHSFFLKCQRQNTSKCVIPVFFISQYSVILPTCVQHVPRYPLYFSHYNSKTLSKVRVVSATLPMTLQINTCMSSPFATSAAVMS